MTTPPSKQSISPAPTSTSGLFFGLKVIATLLLIALQTPGAPAHAQQLATARIGLLGGMSATAFRERMEVFRTQLRYLGYTEGKNILFEERWADRNNDRLGGLAPEATIYVDKILKGNKAAELPVGRPRSFSAVNGSTKRRLNKPGRSPSKASSR